MASVPPTERPPDDVDARKSALRRDLRRARRERAASRDAAQRERLAHDLAAHALAYLDGHYLHRVGAPARCVTLFEALPTEVPTHALLDALHARGIRILLPVLLPDLDLEWFALEDPAHREDPGGIADLRDADSHAGRLLGREGIAQADVVFAPAMAIDTEGRRLGQGGGSYDRALPRRRPGAPVVAVVADEEFGLQPLPSEPHDEPVDAVVTPGGGWVALPLR